MKKFVIVLNLACAWFWVQAQKEESFYFSGPIFSDSNSTLILPIRASTGVFASDKTGLNGYYVNIIFYNFKNDSYKKLFDTNTYIESFERYTYGPYYEKNLQPFKINEWIFYKVKNNDRNHSGRITWFDPTILYVSDINGNQLKQITSKDENLVKLHFFEKQGFVLLEIQRDQNKDDNFDDKDKSFYYVKLDLNTLTLGNKIEVTGNP